MPTTLDQHPLFPILQSFKSALSTFPLKTNAPVHTPTPLEKPTLFIYGPGPRNSALSFDAECVVWQAWLTSCGVEYATEHINEPLSGPKGKLPFLVVPGGKTLNTDQMQHWLSKNYTVHTLADPEKQADSQAIISLVETKLRDALLFSIFCEATNTQLMRQTYFDHQSFPLPHFLAHQAREGAFDEILLRNDTVVRSEIYRGAAQALDALSVTLGEDDYFFGSAQPTFVDATVFGYLHVLLSRPVGTSTTQPTLTEEQLAQGRQLRELTLERKTLVDFAKRCVRNLSNNG
ncbi:hypothetical protein BZG36_04542 [Bifiguratus adelaidae]|uniref:GST N-terminal domain-containing protein n=1 Tax=Bifiguratus adelaidae TaxID=1938954 RepID=A0A261XV43_9FUNG|nr:hypothetical protein BZG36_04542 [Bifiguratus adelaidae]